jgi:hypothetical protein
MTHLAHKKVMPVLGFFLWDRMIISQGPIAADELWQFLEI